VAATAGHPVAFSARRAAPETALVAARRYFEISLYLLVCTSTLTVITTGKLDPLTTLVPPVALLIKGWRMSRGCPAEISHRAATGLTIAYFLFFPLDLFFISYGLAAGAPSQGLYGALLAAVHLMVFAMLVRLFSASTTRDHMFLALTAFAMMLVSAILTVDTAFLAFFLLFLGLAVSTFVGLEMRRSAEGAVSPPLAAGTPAARRLQRALSWTSLIVALSSLLLGAAVFFVIPRVTTGYLSGYNLQPMLMSGFSDNDELGQMGEILQNPAVVMRVRAIGGPAKVRNVKWRGLALTSFDGRSWFTPPHPRIAVTADHQDWYHIYYDDRKETRAPGAGELDRKQLQELGKAQWEKQRAHIRILRYSVLLEPVATDALFTANGSWSQLRGRFSPEVRPINRPSRGSYLLVDRTRSVFDPFQNFVRILYEAETSVADYPAELLRTAPAEYSEQMRETYLQLPRLDPRIPQLAQRLTSDSPTVYDKAAAIERHLSTRFGYTLQLLDRPVEDPLAHFLFWRQAGHCEYFATAMTVMLRTLGIPARYVKGFQTGEYNDVADSYIVRGSHAHTWVEVFFPDYGWVTFDPTPPAGAETRGWLGRFAYYYDWFELSWSEWIVNYNIGRQETLARSLQQASAEWAGKWRKFFQDQYRGTVNAMKSWHSSTVDWLRTSPHLGALVVVLIAAAVLLLTRGRSLRALLAARWGWRLGGAEASAREATLLYQQMLRLLARRGYQKPAGQTPLEFASALPSGELAAPVARFTALYQQSRFGALAADRRYMVSLLGTIKTAVKRP